MPLSTSDITDMLLCHEQLSSDESESDQRNWSSVSLFPNRRTLPTTPRITDGSNTITNNGDAPVATPQTQVMRPPAQTTQRMTLRRLRHQSMGDPCSLADLIRRFRATSQVIQSQVVEPPPQTVMTLQLQTRSADQDQYVTTADSLLTITGNTAAPQQMTQGPLTPDRDIDAAHTVQSVNKRQCNKPRSSTTASTTMDAIAHSVRTGAQIPGPVNAIAVSELLVQGTYTREQVKNCYSFVDWLTYVLKYVHTDCSLFTNDHTVSNVTEVIAYCTGLVPRLSELPHPEMRQFFTTVVHIVQYYHRRLLGFKNRITDVDSSIVSLIGRLCTTGLMPISDIVRLTTICRLTDLRSAIINNADNTYNRWIPTTAMMKFRDYDPELYDVLTLRIIDTIGRLAIVASVDVLRQCTPDQLQRLYTAKEFMIGCAAGDLQLFIDTCIRHRKFDWPMIRTMITQSGEQANHFHLNSLLLCRQHGIIDDATLLGHLHDYNNIIHPHGIEWPSTLIALMTATPINIDTGVIRKILSLGGEIPCTVVDVVHAQCPSVFASQSGWELLVERIKTLLYYENTVHVALPHDQAVLRIWNLLRISSIGIDEALSNVDRYHDIIMSTWCSDDPVIRKCRRTQLLIYLPLMSTIAKRRSACTAMYDQCTPTEQRTVIDNCSELLCNAFFKYLLDEHKASLFEFIRHITLNNQSVSITLPHALIKLKYDPAARAYCNHISESDIVQMLMHSHVHVDDVLQHHLTQLQTSMSNGQLPVHVRAIILEKIIAVCPVQCHKLSTTRYRLLWITDPSWRQYCEVLQSVTPSTPMIIENGSGIDAGGPRREFYGKLLVKMRDMFSVHDGYLLPKATVGTYDAMQIANIISRLVFVDHVKLGLDLHPALLMMMTFPDSITNRTPWSIVLQMMGSWHALININSGVQRTMSSIYADIQTRFPEQYAVMQVIAEAFHKPIALTPRALHHLLINDRLQLNDLSDRLTVGGTTQPDIYKRALLNILRSYDADTLMAFYMLWFASERPDFIFCPGVHVSIYVPNSTCSELNQIRSHTCTHTLEIPCIDTNAGDDYVQTRLAHLMDMALQNQRYAESINWLYQMG